jgi:hypothetical protein
MERQISKEGHGFSRAVNTDSRGCGKTRRDQGIEPMERQISKEGHGFSRAVNTDQEAAKKLGGIKGSSRWKDKSRRKGTALAVP